MPRSQLSATLVGLVVLLSGQVAHAQYNQNQNQQNQRNQPREGPRNSDSGVAEGTVSAFRFMAGQSSKGGSVTVQVGGGRNMTINFGEEVGVELARSQLRGSQARQFLANGVQVSIKWTKARDPKYRGGYWTNMITIQTQQVEGTITRLTLRDAAVNAVPKKETPMERDEPEPIQVNGRQARQAPAKKPPAEVKPKSIRLAFKPEATSFTLDGKETTAKDLVEAAKDRKNMPFDATVVLGNGNIVADFHARSEAAGAGSRNRGPEKASKK